MADIQELIKEKEEKMKKHGRKYTLITNDNVVTEKKENVKILMNKHNPENKNIESVILSINHEGKNYIGQQRVLMNDIIGTSKVDLSHLTWKDSLLFLQRYANILPLEEINIPKFLEKMANNDFAETLKLIEYPKDSKKYYILDGISRIVLARNLGLDEIVAEIYSE